MCLAMPAQIMQKKLNNVATVNLGGIEKEISTVLIDDVKVGDYVVIHVGYALTKLNEFEAKKTLALFSEMAQLNSEEK
jgi:hydrogenase expression/formation protein HypC